MTEEFEEDEDELQEDVYEDISDVVCKERQYVDKDQRCEDCPDFTVISADRRSCDKITCG